MEQGRAKLVGQDRQNHCKSDCLYLPFFLLANQFNAHPFHHIDFTLFSHISLHFTPYIIHHVTPHISFCTSHISSQHTFHHHTHFITFHHITSHSTTLCITISHQQRYTELHCETKKVCLRRTKRCVRGGPTGERRVRYVRAARVQATAR